MAFDEGQQDLFTATYEQYCRAFLPPHPLAFGILIYRDNDPVGFVAYQEKFATYLGRKVFYVEDVYLGKYQYSAEVFYWLLKEIELYAVKGGYCRIEIRRLEYHAPPDDPLLSFHYLPIKKWKIWRKKLA